MNDPTHQTLTEGTENPLPKTIPVPPSESEAQPQADPPETTRESDKPVLPPPPSGSFAAGNAPLNIPMLIAIGVLFVAVYATTFAKFLIPRWNNDPAAQHGWLI
ncbi:MAG: hypothetical protein H7145_09965, partial [Akkermansiaceae bacterium]|nr:hypothetical protein [Armatimonadota bacterium]